MKLTSSLTTSGQAVLAATGELDLVQMPRLAAAIDALVASGTRRLVLDLTGIDFIDSSGVNLIVGRLKALRHLGGDIVVAAEQARVVRPFAASHALDVLVVVPTVEAAHGCVELDAARARRVTPPPAARRSRRTAARRSAVQGRPAQARTSQTRTADTSRRRAS